jgi:hypothetical protein
MKRVLQILTLVLLTGALTVPAHATTVGHSVYTEHVVVANYTATTGCIERDVQLYLSQTLSGTFASVFVGSFDVCHGSTLLNSTGGYLENPSALQIRSNSARLQATFPVHDNLGRTAPPVTVDLTWTGVGLTTMVRDHFVVNIGEQRVVILTFNSGDAYRTAALAGTVVQNGQSLLTGLVGWGQLSSHHSVDTFRYPG